jgi:hypothetical protein
VALAEVAEGESVETDSSISMALTVETVVVRPNEVANTTKNYLIPRFPETGRDKRRYRKGFSATLYHICDDCSGETALYPVAWDR